MGNTRTLSKRELRALLQQYDEGNLDKEFVKELESLNNKPIEAMMDELRRSFHEEDYDIKCMGIRKMRKLLKLKDSLPESERAKYAEASEMPFHEVAEFAENTIREYDARNEEMKARQREYRQKMQNPKYFERTGNGTGRLTDAGLTELLGHLSYASEREPGKRGSNKDAE